MDGKGRPEKPLPPKTLRAGAGRDGRRYPVERSEPGQARVGGGKRGLAKVKSSSRAALVRFTLERYRTSPRNSGTRLVSGLFWNPRRSPVLEFRNVLYDPSQIKIMREALLNAEQALRFSHPSGLTE